jgi:chemotaxis protein MotB
MIKLIKKEMKLVTVTKKIAFAVVVIFSMASCVSQKKYNSLLSEKVKLEGQLSDCSSNLEAMNEKSKKLESQVKQLVNDSTSTGKELRQAQAQLKQLKGDYEKLESNYKGVISNSGKLSKDLAAQQQRLQNMETDLEIAKLRNDELSVSLKEREKRVAELEKVLEEKDKAVNSLKQKVTQALLNFKENELSVEIKNGKVYVSLAEQLLFGSGSATVDSKGVTALQQLSKVLQENKDINILVEGHTDNVPISRASQYMNDNWDLSVIRATSIVRILTRAGVESNRITAAGKGEFYPIATNDSSDNKRRNRRTEIILTPKLDELFKILDIN